MQQTCSACLKFVTRRLFEALPVVPSQSLVSARLVLSLPGTSSHPHLVYRQVRNAEAQPSVAATTNCK